MRAPLSNAGGAGVLAADACAMDHLDLVEPSEHTRTVLRKLLPPQASVRNPIDTTAGIHPATFGACLEALLADGAGHAVLAITAPTAVGDPATSITEAVARARSQGITTPVLAVQLSQSETIGAMPVDAGRPVPSYADPAIAVRALTAAVHYGQWRSRPAGRVPDLPDISLDQARALVGQFLTGHPHGGWLPPASVRTLLCHFGLPVLTGITAADASGAVTALRRLGAPVALKAVARDLLHKSRDGGVVLGVRDEQYLRREAAAMRQRFSDTLEAVFLQPMAPPGRELLVGITSDRTFGPLVVFGLGGVDTDLVADRTARLVPLTDVDADEMMRSLHSFPLLFGSKQPHRLNAAAVRDVLLRIGRLAELLPEVAELDLNPVTADEQNCLIVDARILLRPAVHDDPLLPALPG